LLDLLPWHSVFATDLRGYAFQALVVEQAFPDTSPNAIRLENAASSHVEKHHAILVQGRPPIL
jgi:hypothetical protein